MIKYRLGIGIYEEDEERREEIVARFDAEGAAEDCEIALRALLAHLQVELEWRTKPRPGSTFEVRQT